MFASPVEIIAFATSNSLCVFCFCNLIIIALIVTGSKPTSDDIQDCNYENKIDTEESKEVHLLPGSRDFPRESSKFDNVKEIVHVENKKENKEIVQNENKRENEKIVQNENKKENEEIVDNENEKEDEEGDDELRRKVEEFIAKTNRRWKEEKMRTYHMELKIAVA